MGCAIIPANESARASADRMGVGEGECRADDRAVAAGGGDGACVLFHSRDGIGNGTAERMARTLGMVRRIFELCVFLRGSSVCRVFVQRPLGSEASASDGGSAGAVRRRVRCRLQLVFRTSNIVVWQWT